MRQLVLARHGETEWNALGKLQGHTDIELNAVGREQARALATALGTRRLGAVWTSDLARARQTGEIVAASLGLPAPSIDPELRERRFGVFEGLTRDQCAAQHPEAWSAWLARTATPPGGEPRELAIARMASALARLAASDGEPILVISHGGVMRLWLMQILGDHVPMIANGTGYLIDHDGAGVRARVFSGR